MNELSDFELIKLIREKDDNRAFQLLYDRYWDKLYGIAIAKTHSEENANDIVQDLFVNIWVKRKELNFNYNVDLYLYLSIKNRVINFYKKENLNLEKMKIYSSNADNQTDSTAEDSYSLKEVKALLKKEIDSMPGKMKEIFLLSRNEQLSSKKISEMLLISDQTVRNQLSNAIKRIKNTLGKFGVTQ